MSTLQPRLEVLPPDQQQFWPELRAIPKGFVLYGGTALALRLGHRPSVDFDFFSAARFQPDLLQSELGFAANAEVLQKSENTLSLRTSGTAGVRISFFGGLTFGQVEPPDRCDDVGIYVAGLKDLLATKLNTIYQRAEAKDYLDIDTLLTSGHTLALGLACARAIYRTTFNAMLPLKALTYFEDGDLPALPPDVKRRLVQAVETLTQVPTQTLYSERISTPDA